MNISTKLLKAAAGSAGGAGLDVDDCFSCHLYEGTGSAQTITNNIDLTEGGLVWFRDRDNANGNFLFDTERGATKRLRTHGTFAENTVSTGLTAFNSNGFTIGSNAFMNGSNNAIASWTFRKAPKFFDVVTWTGNGVNGRTISHNLGSTPGMILVKSTGHSDGWITYHRGMDASSPQNYAMFLNLTNARATETYWNNTAPTSTGFTVSSNVKLNGSSGQTYVAYLFAHNNNDGEFGPDGDQDIIKCESFTGSSSSDVTVNVGFEPQWLLTRRTGGGNWTITDNMRGLVTGGIDNTLFADSSSAENTAADRIDLTSTGFIQKSGQTGNETVIYMAIRRGPLAAPDDATKVFAMDDAQATSGSGPAFISNFVTDMFIEKQPSTTGSWPIGARLQGNKYLVTDGTSAEATGTSITWDHMNGVLEPFNVSPSYQGWMWKRAPSFFDVVAYTGGGYNTNVKHNLTVTPELCIAKSRTTNSVVDDWYVWSSHSGDGNDTLGFLNSTGTTAMGFHASSPSSTDLYLHGNVAYSGYPYIMYLFATVAGVSKVGSYTANGNAQNIDCGFSSGARFVLIKRYDLGGHWFVFDTGRGIVSGNDPNLQLNETNAQESTYDHIDPYSAGFTVAVYGDDSPYVNQSGGSYLFYAIA